MRMRKLQEFDTSNVTSVDFRIGPSKTDDTAVPAEETTWDKVKGIFE